MVSGAQVYFSLAGEAHHFRERLLGRGGLDSAGTRHLAADPAGLAAPAGVETTLQPRCSRSSATAASCPIFSAHARLQQATASSSTATSSALQEVLRIGEATPQPSGSHLGLSQARCIPYTPQQGEKSND